MPVRYYPPSKVVTDQVAYSGEFTTADGKSYSGKYYITFDGKIYSGPSPQIGPNEPLYKTNILFDSPFLNNSDFSLSRKNEIALQTKVAIGRVQGKPNSYYPQPIESDYLRGYLIRYFIKKENETIITEISEEEYNSFVNGTADYDISMYQVTKILWKITGPLRNQRQSQYNTIPGIIDTNQRLTESSNKTFLGILEFIGGDYTKFARPTP